MTVDEPLARQWLANVSYYRLSGYWYSYRILVESEDSKRPQRLDAFSPGTTFAEIVALYEFDRKLRTLIHDGVERIEVALRARIGERLVQRGALSYKDPTVFRPGFDHDSWLDMAQRRTDRARKHSPSIRHYYEQYGDYPFWVLADALDFSDLSILFDGLMPQDQREISKSFGVVPNLTQLSSKQKKKYYGQDPLARWCEQLSVLRNICAHRGRTWNRFLPPASTNAFRTMGQLSTLPKGQSERIFGSLIVMSFLMQSISPGTSWPKKLRKLIETGYLPLRSRSISEMGFPGKWQDAFRRVEWGP